MTEHDVRVLKAGPEHDHVLAAHYLAIWESYGTLSEDLVSNATGVIDKFLKDNRAEHGLVSFIAFDGTSAVGSVSCRSDFKAYPVVLRPDLAKEAYIWSVYTDPAHRGKGIGRRLMQTACEHLKSNGYTSITLHSSEAGRSLYSHLGFSDTREMKLKW